MIIVRNSKSNYPFTAASTLLVSSGLRLGAGVVRSANLFPHCGQINFLCISEFGRDRGRNFVVSDDQGNETCVVTFTDVNGVLCGKACDSYGPCGIVTATIELLPILNAHYFPATDSFVFSPSAVFPKTDYSERGVFKSVSGYTINSLSFDPAYFDTSDSQVYVRELEVDTPLPVPVSKIFVNGVEVGDQPEYINILPRGDSHIRIVQDGGNIILGTYDAL